MTARGFFHDPAVCGGAHLRRLLGVALLSGCADNPPPPSEQPSFYKDLAQPDAALDADAAQAMISSYRSSNGLPPVTLDPELMRLASRAGAGHGGER